MNEEHDILRKVFSSITKGYSSFFLKEREIFIKHFTFHEQCDFFARRKNYLKVALENGIPSEEEVLKRLNEYDMWTVEDETRLKNKEKEIDSLIEQKNAIYLPSQIKIHNERIEKEKKALQKMLYDKYKVMEEKTAESVADRNLNEYYLEKCLFLDKEFSIPFFENKQTSDFYDENQDLILKLYSDEIELLSDYNLKKLAIQDFYQVYWDLCQDNVYLFFGKFICDLTIYQVRLANYSKIFTVVLSKSGVEVPPEIRKDPERLLDFVKSKDKASKLMQNNKDGNAVGLVGATEEDYKALGYNDNNSVNISKIMKEKKEKGQSQSLDMHELMKIIG